MRRARILLIAVPALGSLLVEPLYVLTDTAVVGRLGTTELGGLAPGQARWEGPEIFLSPRAANALSLALHELATNAVKFGALSVDTGHVSLRWAVRRNGGFDLTWTETGGPTVTPPTRHGFGATLLEQVTPRELNGEILAWMRGT